LLLALVVAAAGGAVIVVAQGALRTESAFPRLLQSDHAADVLISPNGTGFGGYYAALARLPQVVATATVREIDVGIPVKGAPPDAEIQAEISPGDRYGVAMDRVKILQGHPFDIRDQRSVMVDSALAQREHLQPGGTLRLVGIPTDPQGNPDLVHVIPLSFRVSAIVVFDDQVVAANRFNAYPTALISPAFLETRQAKEVLGADGAAFRLHPDTKSAFVREAEALVPRFPAAGGQVFVADLAAQEAVTERDIRPEAIALALFATFLALVALAIIVQLLSRLISMESLEHRVLRTLGMNTVQLAGLSLFSVITVVVAGAIIALGAAVAASPIMPIGPARLAEPSPGLEVNLGVLAIGFIAIVTLPVLLLLPVALRVARRSRGSTETAQADAIRRAHLGRAVTAEGPITAAIGIQMAFTSGRGRMAVPTRSTVVGSVVALTAVIAALAFGASLNQLVDTPHFYGQNWDRELDLGFGSATAGELGPVVQTQPGVAAYAAGNYGQLSIGGITVPAIGLDALRGGGFLTLLAGRAPTTPRQVALGARTLLATHLHVGQWTPVTIDGTTRTMQVVGEVVMASFSEGSFTATDLGSGAVVTASAFKFAPGNGCASPATCFNFVLVRYRPKTNVGVSAVHLETIAAAAGCPAPYCPVVADQRPKDIDNYTRIRNTPAILAGLLAALGVATLTYALVTSVQRRRRDLAVLKTLGLRRSQISALVAWHASAVAAVAVLIGIPLGLLAGRWAWAVFADAVGVPADVVVPWLWIALAVPITLVVANLIALGPGWLAGRIKPATALRSE
jgi:hypothetical protein